MKNKMKGNYCCFLFAILNQRNSCFLSKGTGLLFLIRTHSCSTKSKSPRSKRDLKIGGSVSDFSFGVFEKSQRSKRVTTFVLNIHICEKSLGLNMIIPLLVWQPGPVVSLQYFEALRERGKKSFLSRQLYINIKSS